MMEKAHLGIVGCSAEGAALCYRTFCVEGAEIFGEHAHPEVSMHTHSLAEYMACIYRDDWAGVAELMLSSARRLTAAGATVLVCPDNTIHQAFSLVEPTSPLPWLHIARVVAEEASRAGIGRLAVLGTRYLMEGPVYPEACARAEIETTIPDAPTREQINRIIFEELVYGRLLPQSRDFFHAVIADLAGSGCDGVVLGCTEIPLIVEPESVPIPCFDSTRLLARAALRRCAQALKE